MYLSCLVLGTISRWYAISRRVTNSQGDGTHGGIPAKFSGAKQWLPLVYHLGCLCTSNTGQNSCRCLSIWCSCHTWVKQTHCQTASENGSYYSNGHITGNHLECVLRDVGFTANFTLMVSLTMELGELRESTCARVGYDFNLPCYGLLRWMSWTSFLGDHVQVQN